MPVLWAPWLAEAQEVELFGSEVSTGVPPARLAVPLMPWGKAAPLLLSDRRGAGVLLQYAGPGIGGGSAYVGSPRREGLPESVPHRFGHGAPAPHLPRRGSPKTSLGLVGKTVLLDALAYVGHRIGGGCVYTLVGMTAVAQELVEQHRQGEVVAVLRPELPPEVVDLGRSVLGAAHHAGIRLVPGRARDLEAVAVDQHD